MYGDGKTADHPDQAGEFAAQAMSNFDQAKDVFLAGLEQLKGQETVDSQRLAAIGYCFGGGTVLNMARAGVDLKGVVSFHGSLGAAIEAEPGSIKAKILVAHGADDAFVPQDVIDAFKAEMEEAGADLTFNSYEGAKHYFTNPDADRFAEQFGMGLAYNRQADEQSWADMQEFFLNILK